MNHSPNKLGMYRLKTETKMRSKEVYTKVKKVVENERRNVAMREDERWIQSRPWLGGR